MPLQRSRHSSNCMLCIMLDDALVIAKSVQEELEVLKSILPLLHPLAWHLHRERISGIHVHSHEDGEQRGLCLDVLRMASQEQVVHLDDGQTLTLHCIRYHLSSMVVLLRLAGHTQLAPRLERKMRELVRCLLGGGGRCRHGGGARAVRVTLRHFRLEVPIFRGFLACRLCLDGHRLWLVVTRVFECRVGLNSLSLRITADRGYSHLAMRVSSFAVWQDELPAASLELSLGPVRPLDVAVAG